MDPGSQCSDLPVRQDARLVCIYFIKDLGKIQGLHRTHEVIEIREGELHVLRVAHLVKRCLVKFLGEPVQTEHREFGYLGYIRYQKSAFMSYLYGIFNLADRKAVAHHGKHTNVKHTGTHMHEHTKTYISCSSCMMILSIMWGMWAGTFLDVNPNLLLRILLTYRSESANVSFSCRPARLLLVKYASCVFNVSSSCKENST